MGTLRDKLVAQLASLQASIIDIQNKIDDEDNGRRFFAGDVLKHKASGKSFMLCLIGDNTFCFIGVADGKYRKSQFFVQNGEVDGILLTEIIDVDQIDDFELVE